MISFLSRYYGCEVNYTDNVNEYNLFDGVRINYSEQPINAGEVWIKPAGLLHENKIWNLGVDCINHKEGFIVLFPSDNDTGFDIFSAIFYLVSRYEEYLPSKKDMYGRYAYENSIAFKNDFLHLPLIDIWLLHLKKIILLKTGKNINTSNFKFLPTYDIDIAWSYKNKGILRNSGGILQSLVQLNFKKVNERIRVLTGQIQDPFETFSWMENLHQQYNLNPIYFFHVGLHKSIYDKNISPRKPQMQQLIKSIAIKYQVGLHPSWISGERAEALEKEKTLLENITGKKINSSRQHYIRLSFPETYRKLIAAGIKDDYSMGYGSINGFRASITTPFLWYDLEHEKETDLVIHPFCFMDANSFYEQNQNADETLTELNQYLTEVKKVGGTFITIWHHNFFGTDEMYKGWSGVYKSFLTQL